MSTITTKDGTQIYYKDWSAGPPVLFSHGWPLSADSWESQMVFLASNGYRCTAHDRRGHGTGVANHERQPAGAGRETSRASRPASAASIAYKQLFGTQPTFSHTG